jgi:hypothetical protein
MRERLIEIVEAFNHRGIEITLLKGAAALWTGEPAWRSMRDLDILVPQRFAENAQALLAKMGYRPAPDAERSVHHLEIMLRDDLPGWVELHTKTSNGRGESILPSEILLRDTISSPLRDRPLQVRLLNPAHQALHGLVHHHFANRGAAYGVIAPKGLFEFAHSFFLLDSDGREVLLRTALHHARLAAAVDLWIAAAVNLFGLRTNAALRLETDAEMRWKNVRRRMENDEPCSFFEALREDARMSLSGRRLANAVAAGSHRSRFSAGVQTLRTFLGETPSSARRRAAARQRATGFTPLPA